MGPRRPSLCRTSRYCYCIAELCPTPGNDNNEDGILDPISGGGGGDFRRSGTSGSFSSQSGTAVFLAEITG